MQSSDFTFSNLRICLRWREKEQKKRRSWEDSEIAADRSIDIDRGDFKESSKIIESQRTIVKDEGIGDGGSEVHNDKNRITISRSCLAQITRCLAR